MSTLSGKRGWFITAVIALAVGAGSFALVRDSPWAKRDRALVEAFQSDLSDLIRVDPEKIQYEQVAAIRVPLERLRAIAVDPAGRILVGGDQNLAVFDAAGSQLHLFSLGTEPFCLAVGGPEHTEPGQIYVGMSRRIGLVDADGMLSSTWDLPDENARITSIAAGRDDLWVADAGNKQILRFDPGGQLLGRIGAPDPSREMPGWIVPGLDFDLAVGSDWLVHVANPGARRVEAFSVAGELQSYWGESSPRLHGFFGCCNPSHLAILPDGRFVTFEKGIPRVKVYDPLGRFECVVAGTAQLGIRESEVGDPRCTVHPLTYDIATDPEGRVLVLDSRDHLVRIYQRLETIPPKQTEPDKTDPPKPDGES